MVNIVNVHHKGHLKIKMINIEKSLRYIHGMVNIIDTNILMTSE